MSYKLNIFSGLLDLTGSSGASGITIGTTTITGGADTQVLFNDTGEVGSDAGLTYNKTTDSLSVVGRILAGGGGADSTPGISFIDDPNTGFRGNLLADYIHVIAGGARYMQIGDVFKIGDTGFPSTIGLTAGSFIYLSAFYTMDIRVGGTITSLFSNVSSTYGHKITIAVQRGDAQTAPLLQLQTVAGASLGNVGGTIFNSFTDTSTTSTDGTENDLYSYTTVANTLYQDGDSIHQIEHVQFVSSATASRRLKKYFAGTLIFDSGALTLSLGGDFFLETTIIRESSTVVRVSVNVVTTSASSVPYATYTRITSLTLTGTNILKTTGIAAGAGAASGDIVEKLSKVFNRPAA